MLKILYILTVVVVIPLSVFRTINWKRWTLLYILYLNKKKRKRKNPMGFTIKNANQGRAWETSLWGSWHSRKLLTSPSLSVLCFTFPHILWTSSIMHSQTSQARFWTIKILPNSCVGCKQNLWAGYNWTHQIFGVQIIVGSPRSKIPRGPTFSAAKCKICPVLTGISSLEIAPRGLLQSAQQTPNVSTCHCY